MAAVPPPPPPLPPPHYHHHHHDHDHQHQPHMDPSRRAFGLSCGPALAGSLLPSPAPDDDDPGDNDHHYHPTIRIAPFHHGQVSHSTTRQYRPDAAAAVAFLSSISFHPPAPAPTAPAPIAPAPTASDVTHDAAAVTVHQDAGLVAGASPTLVVVHPPSTAIDSSVSVSMHRSPRDRAAIAFLSAIDFGGDSFATTAPAPAQPASFSDPYATPSTGADTPILSQNPTDPDTGRMHSAPMVASSPPLTFRSALASPRLSAAAAARSVRRKFRLAVNLSTAFSPSSSSSSTLRRGGNKNSNPNDLGPAGMHPLAIDTSPMLASPSVGPSPRTGRAPSLLFSSAVSAASPYPALPPQQQSTAADLLPPLNGSSPLYTASRVGPRRAAYLVRPHSLPVVWASLFPFDRRTAMLPVAPSVGPAPVHSASLGGPAGGDSLASLNAPMAAEPNSSGAPVVVGMVAVVVAAALDKAGRRNLGGGRPAVSYAGLLAPTGALCSEAERRAAAALVVDAAAVASAANGRSAVGALSAASVTGGVLAAVSMVSIGEDTGTRVHGDTATVDPPPPAASGGGNSSTGSASGGPVPPPQLQPQAAVVCDFMLARASACLAGLAGTERDVGCSRRASDGSAAGSVEAALDSAARKDRDDLLHLVHASLVDELDLQGGGGQLMASAGVSGGGGEVADGAVTGVPGGGGGGSSGPGNATGGGAKKGTLLHVMYDAAQLDDPALTTGRHKTVISLPGMMGSILQYTRPSELKKELNEKFRQTHPEVDPSLTLSQIRNLKRRLIDVGNTFNLEVSSLAKAFVYFEKLVLKRAVIKSNRRLVGAICLLLACKVNEPKETLSIGALLEAMAKSLGGISVKDIREHEFAVFAQLEFNLYLPQHEFMPHFERICAIKDISSLQDYIS